RNPCGISRRGFCIVCFCSQCFSGFHICGALGAGERQGWHQTVSSERRRRVRGAAEAQSGRRVHLRCTMPGPDSSYSCLEIHICWKVLSEARMEPPIQTEYLRSGGATILIFMVDGARLVISFCMRSAMPGYMVVPPDSTVLAYRSFLMSTSHFMMLLKVVSWMPDDSMPRKDGWNRASGQRKRSLPMGAAAGGGGHLLLEVQGDVAQLLLDVADDLALGGGGEAVAALSQDLHQVVGEVAAGQVQTQDGVRQGVALVDRHGVGDAIAGVQHDAGGAAAGVQGQHSLDGDVHGRRVEGLEHDLGHLLAVGLRVQRSLGQQHGVLLRGHAELVVEGVVPDLLHVVPVGHDAVLDRVLQRQDAALALGLVADIAVLLAHTDHDTLRSSEALLKLTWWRGRPTMEGNTARGASSPAKPALHMPEPLLAELRTRNETVAAVKGSGPGVRRLISCCRSPGCAFPNMVMRALWNRGWSGLATSKYGHHSTVAIGSEEEQPVANLRTRLLHQVLADQVGQLVRQLLHLVRLDVGVIHVLNHVVVSRRDRALVHVLRHQEEVHEVRHRDHVVQHGAGGRVPQLAALLAEHARADQLLHHNGLEAEAAHALAVDFRQRLLQLEQLRGQVEADLQPVVQLGFASLYDGRVRVVLGEGLVQREHNALHRDALPLVVISVHPDDHRALHRDAHSPGNAAQLAGDLQGHLCGNRHHLGRVADGLGQDALAGDRLVHGSPNDMPSDCEARLSFWQKSAAACSSRWEYTKIQALSQSARSGSTLMGLVIWTVSGASWRAVASTALGATARPNSPSTRWHSRFWAIVLANFTSLPHRVDGSIRVKVARSFIRFRSARISSVRPVIKQTSGGRRTFSACSRRPPLVGGRSRLRGFDIRIGCSLSDKLTLYVWAKYWASEISSLWRVLLLYLGKVSVTRLSHSIASIRYVLLLCRVSTICPTKASVAAAWKLPGLRLYMSYITSRTVLMWMILCDTSTCSIREQTAYLHAMLWKLRRLVGVIKVSADHLHVEVALGFSKHYVHQVQPLRRVLFDDANLSNCNFAAPRLDAGSKLYSLGRRQGLLGVQAAAIVNKRLWHLLGIVQQLLAQRLRAQHRAKVGGQLLPPAEHSPAGSAAAFVVGRLGRRWLRRQLAGRPCAQTAGPDLRPAAQHRHVRQRGQHRVQYSAGPQVDQQHQLEHSGLVVELDEQQRLGQGLELLELGRSWRQTKPPQGAADTAVTVEHPESGHAAVKVIDTRWESNLEKLNSKLDTPRHSEQVDKLDTTMADRATALESINGNRGATASVAATTASNPMADQLGRIQGQLTELAATVAAIGMRGGQQGGGRGGSRGRGSARGRGGRGRCFNCSIPGHFAAQCPSRQSASAPQITCYRCSGQRAPRRGLVQLRLRKTAEDCRVGTSRRALGINAQLQPPLSAPVGIDGRHLESPACATLTVQLQGLPSIVHQVTVVAGIQPECVLGMDAIGRMGSAFSVDLGASSVQLGPAKIPILQNDGFQQACRVVPNAVIARVARTVEVPARSRNIVPVKVDSSSEQGLFEPNSDFTDKTGLLSNRVLAVSNTEGGLPVGVCNLGADPHEKSFASHEFDLGTTPLLQHEINREPGSRPIKQRQRTVPLSFRQQVDDKISKMRRHGIIEPSCSPWANNLLVVRQCRGGCAEQAAATRLAPAWTTSDILDAQQADAVLVAIRKLPTGQTPQQGRPAVEAAAIVAAERLEIDDGGIIRRGGEPVIPLQLRQELLRLAHDDPPSGHLAPERTLARIDGKGWWPSIKEDLQHWVNSCENCQHRKVPHQHQRAPLQSNLVPSLPWEIVRVDIKGPLPATDTSLGGLGGTEGRLIFMWPSFKSMYVSLLIC
uniref:CCHC-type domain-containing protein n=1 Tax=Macrostomum lignano TaxID=282301 RepID=A0A1I8HJH4_9PLAT